MGTYNKRVGWYEAEILIDRQGTDQSYILVRSLAEQSLESA